jgi:tripartite ATP-independent transporter DctM subunit
MMLIVLLLVLVALGVPVSFALGLSGVVFFITHDIKLVTFAQNFAVGIDSFSLLAAPFFILVGNIMNESGITKKIFRFANSIVGCFPGGLGHVNILASTLFAGMSGTAIADAAGLGPIEIKAMTDEGYDIEFSTAVTAASSVVGPIIPPSTVMILYGVTAGVSIRELFMGGVMPGLVIAICLKVMVALYSVKRHYPISEAFSFRELGRSFLDAIWALLTPLILIGGILGGIFTATESGAIASVYALFISLFVYKTISWKKIPKILWSTACTTGTILIIVATASIFGWCLTYERVPQAVALFLTEITTNKMVLMLLIAVIYLFLGMIMETSAIVLTTVPIIIPVVSLLHINLVYLGVIVAILMSIGTITPPVGTVLFVLSKITGLSIEKITKEMVPWYVVLLVAVITLIVFPDIILWLPGLTG